jgi:cytidylate kinase
MVEGGKNFYGYMMIIAIDGPSGVGKGTLSRRVAQHYGLLHLDTGLIYRTLGLLLHQTGMKTVEEEVALKVARSMTLGQITENPDLRTQEVASLASRVSVFPSVRSALLDMQREFAFSEKGAVLDGRDIGTIVLPNADFKIFLMARPEVRAHRRLKELREKGTDPGLGEVLREILVRDRRDSTRTAAPLRPAEDAYILDTSDLTAEEVFQKTLSFISRI